MEKVSTMEGNLSLSVVGQVKRQSCRKAIPSIHRNLVCNVSFRCNIIHLAECSSTRDGKQVYLGTFDVEVDAAKAYDTFVLLHYGIHAKTNGLVDYEEIKHIDIESLLKTKRKLDLHLPTNIYKLARSFKVNITYKSTPYIDILPTLELAKLKLAEFATIIETTKKEEHDKIMAMEILRNEDGEAIIPMGKHGNLFVSDHRWHDCMHYTWTPSKQYFRATINGKHVKIHHYILGVSGDDILVDHDDHNTRNNKDDNVRLSNSTNNNHNRTKKPDASSKYFGVSFNTARNRFYSSIQKDGTTYRLGCYINENQAALSFNVKAVELYGTFAQLNIIDPVPSDTQVVLNNMLENPEPHDTLIVSSNCHNRLKKKNCSSQYYGVSFNKSRNMFSATIKKGSDTYRLGFFSNEEYAAKIYNAKALELYGESANLNDVDSPL